jgi:PilZ domain
MESDRRQYFRKEPRGQVYAQFGKTNGGLVLNASLGGLSFQTVAPAQLNSIVNLTVSPSEEKTIEVTGKIAWLDATGKTGGLEFVNPSPQVRAQIKDWLFPQGLPASRGPSLVLPGAVGKPQRPAVELSAAFSPNNSSVNAPVFQLPSSYKSRVATPRMFGGFTDLAKLPDFAGAENARKSTGGFLRGVTNLLLFCLLLTLPAMYIYNFYPQFANSVIDRAKALLPGNNTPQQAETSQPSSAPTETPKTAAPQEPSKIDSPIPDTTTTNASPTPPSPSTANAPAVIPQRPAEKPAPEPAPVKHPAAPSSKPAPQVTNSKLPIDPNDPNELWLAVGQGDTDAEVALANLYKTGHLVEKNCNQARVLLTAAAKKGNAEGITQLRELTRSGCH